ncbi:hypothetical protein IP84_16915 [beta proteobacterium AAP99]|nr:hypothetical protein IP84_16915 [beta proteobacterium AAP99]
MHQIPLRLLAEIGDPAFVPETVMARIETEADAWAWCWALRRIKGMTATEAARHLGMPKSHFSNILSGKKYPSWGSRIAFQRLCGNWCIRQWEDRQLGLVTLRETAEQRRIRELEQQVAAMQRAA